ncbi:unnamed protein product, partial [Laminaria digitata]
EFVGELGKEGACPKLSCFGVAGQRQRFCFRHKLPGMVDVVNSNARRKGSGNHITPPKTHLVGNLNAFGEQGHEDGAPLAAAAAPTNLAHRGRGGVPPGEPSSIEPSSIEPTSTN